MSALDILPPNKEYAPKAYKKYYDGYDPQLLEEIEREWMLCNRSDFKKSTPIKYARLAQLYFKQQLENEESKSLEGHVFVEDFDATQFIDISNIDEFGELLAKHIDRLIEIVQETYKVTNLEDIKLDISWYNRGLNSMTNTVKSFMNLINDKKNPNFDTLNYAKTIFRWIHRDGDPVILNLLYGWKVYASENGKRIFIKMLYRNGYEERRDQLKKEDLDKWREREEERLNRNQYGYGNGAYNGD